MATSGEESAVGDDVIHLKNKASQSIENNDGVTDTDRVQMNTDTAQETPGSPSETSIVRSCIPGCRYRSKGGGDQIRCCVCGIWYHIKCLKLPSDECAGVWPCFDCRSMASDIKSVKVNILTLTTNVQSLIDSHTMELNHLRQRCDKLEKDNESLKERNKHLEDELTKLKTSRSVSPAENQTKTSLLIGSSIIRDIDAEKLRDTEVVCLPGGHIGNVHNFLRQSESSFKDITILVGGNDCAARTDPEPVAELLQQYKTMVAEANRLAGDIRVATVIPRIPRADNDLDVSERIDAFNAGLVSLCQDNDNYRLIDNDEYFKLRDGDINDGYILHDGTHLTKNGSNKLAKSLQLRTIPTANSDVTKTGKKRGYSDALKKAPPSVPRRAVTQAHTQATRRVPLTGPTQNQACPDSPPGGAPVNARVRQQPPRSWQTGQTRDRDFLHERHSDEDYVGTRQYFTDNQSRSDFRTQELPRCFNCHETNHMSDSCRHKTKVTCFKCGRRGHKEKHCF